MSVERSRLPVVDAASIVRASICSLLREYIVAPLFNAREKDYQAVLFAMLRERIPGQVPVTFEIDDGRPNTRHAWSEPRTSRVHIEMCFGKKGRAGESTKPDIIVLRDQPVVLRCSVDGPTDVQETLGLDDVEIAIELKAAPSQNTAQARLFVNDIEKLAKLQRAHRSLGCFAIVIDKSLSITGAYSKGIRIADWLGEVRPDLQHHATRPDGPCVEVWFIDPRLIAPCQAFFTTDDLVEP